VWEDHKSDTDRHKFDADSLKFERDSLKAKIDRNDVHYRKMRALDKGFIAGKEKTIQRLLAANARLNTENQQLKARIASIRDELISDDEQSENGGDGGRYRPWRA
jgi:hypothetical protein